MGRGKKRTKKGSSSSSIREDDEEDMLAPGSLHLLQESIDCLKKVVTEGFAGINADMDKLRHEFRAEIDGVKGTIKDVEKKV